MFGLISGDFSVQEDPRVFVCERDRERGVHVSLQEMQETGMM